MGKKGNFFFQKIRTIRKQFLGKRLFSKIIYNQKTVFQKTAFFIVTS